MRIVYFGSGEFGIPTLEALSRAHEIVGVVTQPDKPAGRGGALTATQIADWAAKGLPGVPVIKPERCNAPEYVDEIHEWSGPGIGKVAWVVIAFGQKLSPWLLKDHFAINLHASLLPRWRGAAPINTAILEGDEESGNSVITLAEAMDAGLVLGQSRRAIGPATTAGELHDALAADGPALVEQVLSNYAAGKTDGVKQDESYVTHAPKLSKADGWVNLGVKSEVCRRRINGLSPWPGVTVRFRGEELKLLRAATFPEGGLERVPAAGTVIDAGAGLIACGQGTALHLLEVQPAGKRVMTWRDFANGHRVKAEELLEGGRGA